MLPTPPDFARVAARKCSLCPVWTRTGCRRREAQWGCGKCCPVRSDYADGMKHLAIRLHSFVVGQFAPRWLAVSHSNRVDGEGLQRLARTRLAALAPVRAELHAPKRPRRSRSRTSSRRRRTATVSVLHRREVLAVHEVQHPDPLWNSKDAHRVGAGDCSSRDFDPAAPPSVRSCRFRREGEPMTNPGAQELGVRHYLVSPWSLGPWSSDLLPYRRMQDAFTRHHATRRGSRGSRTCSVLTEGSATRRAPSRMGWAGATPSSTRARKSRR